MKQFFIKLISITFAIIIIIKVIFNLIIADHLVGIKRVLSLSDNEVRKDLGDKIRDEVKSSLKKDNIINNADKIILYQFYKKILKEFEEIELNESTKK
jgi:hypothetical protein